MATTLPDTMYYGLIAVAVLLPLFTIMITIMVFKQVPWAWTMYKCYRDNVPCIFKHYPKGGLDIAEPKLEKELKDGIPHTFFTVEKWGFRFPDIAGDNTELLMGKLRVLHYFSNGVSPVSVIDTVALDRLKEWLNKKGVNIHNREDVILFFMNNQAKIGNIREAIDASSIEDVETKKLILDAIKAIEDNKDELIESRIKDGVFTFQTAMMSLDRLIAFTSAAFSNAKSAIEAQVRAKQAEDKNKDLYRMVIFAVIIMIGGGLAYAIISRS